MSARLGACVVLVSAMVAVGCGSGAAELEANADGPVPQPALDLGELPTCVVAVQVMSVGGCVMEWICADGGLLTLSCIPADGGSACRCAEESDARVTSPSSAPASCDEATLTQFARDQCGFHLP